MTEAIFILWACENFHSESDSKMKYNMIGLKAFLMIETSKIFNFCLSNTSDRKMAFLHFDLLFWGDGQLPSSQTGRNIVNLNTMVLLLKRLLGSKYYSFFWAGLIWRPYKL